MLALKLDDNIATRRTVGATRVPGRSIRQGCPTRLLGRKLGINALDALAAGLQLHRGATCADSLPSDVRRH